MTAADIASGVDTSTVAGHNLRALLLRVMDGADWRDAPWGSAAWAAARGRQDLPDKAARRLAVDLGLAVPTSPDLTPLGREVAERLRPAPWRVKAHRFHGDAKESWLVDQAGDFTHALCYDERSASRIAALLTADDLRAAKAYKVES